MSSIKDSGKREAFNTGAQRDTQEGKGFYDCLPFEALRRLAVHMENGARKYDKNNWRKGMPQSRFLNSALRHLSQFANGARDEDHLAAVLFNIGGIIEMEAMVKAGLLDKALLDLPNWVSAPVVTVVAPVKKGTLPCQSLDFYPYDTVPARFNPPAGYVFTGEMREAKLGEWYASGCDGSAHLLTSGKTGRLHILHPIYETITPFMPRFEHGDGPFANPDQRPLAPAGYRLTGEYRKARSGEYIVHSDNGSALTHVGYYQGKRWILVKDNTPTVPAPRDFTFTGEFRPAQPGEFYLGEPQAYQGRSEAFHCNIGTGPYSRHILRPSVEAAEGFTIMSYRLPKKGELYLNKSHSGVTHRSTIDFTNIFQFVIEPTRDPLVPRGYALTGEFRVPTATDLYMSHPDSPFYAGQVVTNSNPPGTINTDKDGGKRYIVEKVYE